jgi:hypothetical protein
MAVDWQPGRPLMTALAEPPSAEELRTLLWLVAAALALLLAALHSVRIL